MKKFKILFLIAAMSVALVAGAQDAEEPENETRIIIYPVLWQAPIYGAEIRVPALPGGGGGGGGEEEGGEISRSSDFGLDSAFLAGFTIERDRWFFDFEAEYAGLSTDHESPLLILETDVMFFSATGGWKVYKDFSITGGVKRLELDIHAEFGNQLEANAEPGVWDPMVGIDWRPMVNRKLQLKAGFEVGGFGAGTDLDVSGNFEAIWEALPHVVLNAGYGFLYFRQEIGEVRIGPFQRELEIKQTLHGPRFGLGFVF